MPNDVSQEGILQSSALLTAPSFHLLRHDVKIRSRLSSASLIRRLFGLGMRIGVVMHARSSAFAILFKKSILSQADRNQPRVVESILTAIICAHYVADDVVILNARSGIID
jgi:hypothetical protein